MPRGDYNLHVRNDDRDKSSWTFGEGNISWFPSVSAQFDDFEQLASEHIFGGSSFYPIGPVFEKEDKLITMGSCFAQRMRDWLKKNGRYTEFILVPSGLNNSFAVRQYIEWCLTGNRSEDAYWYDTSDHPWESPYEQQVLLKALKATKGFVMTFGLAEVWRDKVTKGVFWRGVPQKTYDKDRHECVVSSVSENLDNMKRIYRAIKDFAGEDKIIIYTLSPIPLKATFLERPAIVSDCVSKSTLRVALDEFFKLGLPDVYYWPSFELFRWAGAHSTRPTMGYHNESREIEPEMVKIVIDNFVKRYFK